MALPSFPTDNLYKFIFIGGLTLCIGCLILLATQANNILNEVDQATYELAEVRAHDGALKNEIDQLNKETDALSKKMEKFDKDTINVYDHFKKMIKEAQEDRNYRNYLDFAYRNRSFLIPYYKENELLQEKTQVVIVKQNERQIKGQMILAKAELIKSHYSQLILLLCNCLVFLCIGLSMVVKGYNLWYHNLQYYLDEKVRIEFELLKHQMAEIAKEKELQKDS